MSGDEVFATCMRIAQNDIWLAWASGEGGDYFLSDHGEPVWHPTREGLEALVDVISPGCLQPEHSRHDVDAILRGFESETLGDPDDVLTTWNLFTDFFQCKEGRNAGKFFNDASEIYWRVFSMCDVAAMVSVQQQAMADGDLEMLREVFRRGSSMVLDSTVGCMRRAH